MHQHLAVLQVDQWLVVHVLVTQVQCRTAQLDARNPNSFSLSPMIESEHANSKSVSFLTSVFMRLCFAHSKLDHTNASSMVDATRLINAGSDSPGGIPALNGSCASAS